ncbi:MAG: hypothetical protein ACXWXO_20885 [Nocardioides sp.]
MNPESATQLVIVLLSACVVASIGGWARFGRTVWPPIALVLLAATGVAAAVPDELDTSSRAVATMVVVLAGATAALGGGPLTTRVFAAVDAQAPSPGPGPDPIEAAGAVLRGGTWIGALERGAVFASLAVGMSEGVAVVLALKGLGRYPELRNPEDSPGAAERFIIGTFTSVLWAAACAGVLALTVR